MPTFKTAHMSISIDDFLSACSYREIIEIISALVEDHYLPSHILQYNNDEQQSASEQLFEESLVKLHSNWNRLTTEEEDTITKISNRL